MPFSIPCLIWQFYFAVFYRNGKLIALRIYSIARNPLATAAAQAGIEHITQALPKCTVNGSDRLPAVRCWLAPI
jgi:hypothetical protein